ncbi:hypothetical protein [Promicromonospora sp. NPDC023987]|uniref:hypothetical protein n=1 Tax=Promicromonospora sp. NPDC023987 TaxID=3155360 RepID=UPI0034088462
MRHDLTATAPTSPSRGSFVRRHGTTIGLSILLVCAVAYGVDGKQDNDILHAANDALSGDLATVTGQKDDAESRATTLEREVETYGDRETELQEREDEVAGLEADVAAREKAVTNVEKEIEASQVTDGTWSVGSDVQPGTYRTKEAVSSNCYWEITAGGSNGSDIIENDIPGGGYPVVTVQDGQVFTSARCGTWAKQ